ncbi:hypothetical protein AB0F91_01160 [Amycolatopsis sp. NPDC023774]|uniref:hypothetical protein n=1 Tax=Amycolatopsis sp. NPDC023774 TaxID=3155015 RepID=UPI0033EEDC81
MSLTQYSGGTRDGRWPQRLDGHKLEREVGFAMTGVSRRDLRELLLNALPDGVLDVGSPSRQPLRPAPCGARTAPRCKPTWSWPPTGCPARCAGVAEVRELPAGWHPVVGRLLDATPLVLLVMPPTPSNLGQGVPGPGRGLPSAVTARASTSVGRWDPPRLSPSAPTP